MSLGFLAVAAAEAGAAGATGEQITWYVAELGERSRQMIYVDTR